MESKYDKLNACLVYKIIFKLPKNTKALASYILHGMFQMKRLKCKQKKYLKYVVKFYEKRKNEN